MGREFGDRPGDEVVEVLWGELSRELGTDGPEFTETRHGQDDNRIGHLISQDDEDGADRTSEEIARDSHDTSDLSAEESAMHFEEDGGVEETLSDDILHDLEAFED
jgi:hypothetical protein